MNLYPKPTLQAFRSEILAYFKAHPARPILIGQIALLTHRSCKEAEGYLEELEGEGLIRQATKEELRRHGVVCGYYRTADLQKTG